MDAAATDNVHAEVVAHLPPGIELRRVAEGDDLAGVDLLVAHAGWAAERLGPLAKSWISVRPPARL